MEYRTEVLEKTKILINAMCGDPWGIEDYANYTKNLYGFWKKIVPETLKSEQLMTYIELKTELNDAESALRGNPRNSDAIYVLKNKIRTLEDRLEKIDSFKTETQAIEGLLIYLEQVRDKLEKLS
jgi:hypothetical protein